MLKIIITILYIYFRSQNDLTFTLEPYSLKKNDLLGILFFCVSLIPNHSYSFIYCLIPLRNLFMNCIQKIIPYLKENKLENELIRNIIAQSFIICCVLLFIYFDSNKVNQEYFSTNFTKTLEIIFIIQSILFTIIGTLKRFDSKEETKKSFILLKLIFSILLGFSEELQWREFFQNKTDIYFQALVWGLNHFVKGEGIESDFQSICCSATSTKCTRLLYFILATLYAYFVGLLENNNIKYASHISIEWLVIDNLIK